MRRLASFLVASVLVAVPCCGRTGLGTAVPGAGGTKALGGITATGGAPVTGGMPGAGGSASTTVGSTSPGDLDACSSDDDCTTSCTWTTAPTDSSQCFGEYCCGSNWMSKRRCEANRAAWAIYCITSPCPQCSGATVVGDSRLLGRQRDRAGRSDGGHGGSLQIRRSVFTA